MRQARFDLALGCAMPALLAGQSPHCRERGRCGNLMIDLNRIVAPREPLRRALQGAGEQSRSRASRPSSSRSAVNPKAAVVKGGDGEPALAIVPLVVAALGILLLGEVREAGAEGPPSAPPGSAILRPRASRRKLEARGGRAWHLLPGSGRRRSPMSCRANRRSGSCRSSASRDPYPAWSAGGPQPRQHGEAD